MGPLSTRETEGKSDVEQPENDRQRNVIAQGQHRARQRQQDFERASQAEQSLDARALWYSRFLCDCEQSRLEDIRLEMERLAIQTAHYEHICEQQMIARSRWHYRYQLDKREAWEHTEGLILGFERQLQILEARREADGGLARRC